MCFDNRGRNHRATRAGVQGKPHRNLQPTADKELSLNSRIVAHFKRRWEDSAGSRILISIGIVESQVSMFIVEFDNEVLQDAVAQNPVTAPAYERPELAKRCEVEKHWHAEVISETDLDAALVRRI